MPHLVDRRQIEEQLASSTQPICARAEDRQYAQPGSYVGVGRICERRGEVFETFEYLKRAIELQPMVAQYATPESDWAYPSHHREVRNGQETLALRIK